MARWVTVIRMNGDATLVNLDQAEVILPDAIDGAQTAICFAKDSRIYVKEDFATVCQLARTGEGPRVLEEARTEQSDQFFKGKG